MTHDPEAIRRLTQRYRTLRGFEQLPLAVCVLATQATAAAGLLWSPLVFVVTAALSLPTMRAIGRYYDRRFGTVKAPGWGSARWAAILITFVALQAVSKQLALPVELGFLAAGIALAIYAVRHFELEGQRLLIAVYLVGASVWPPFFDPEHAGGPWRNAFGLGFAAIWIVMSIWDHRTLVKAFERMHVARSSEGHLSSR